MRLLIHSALWLAACGLVCAKTKPKSESTAPRTGMKSVAELTEAARSSIVTVTQIGRAGMHETLGTGFIISADGLIATNMHVIGHARRIQVKFSDGESREVTAIQATDPSLDLALIKVDAKGLKPLPLGDSDKVKQGEPVFAIGHPQGLQYSVVEGVVSAIREVDGSKMIQIAIPIEEGNSGGPLMDFQGRVQGVMTLKSVVTENLGFAHCVNDLKRLINRPNPVLMERWLTIGRLDPAAWQTLYGARWTQHAGVIHVEDAGESFGGRALCLAKKSAPGIPFECAVTVKLDSENGAAGLVFCSDGRDQHYGFYPSGGQLRLTRFNGPDVFSWTILADVPVAAYRKGQWNTLRVRVDEEKIQCFVNDKLAIERNDTELRGGAVGLCKFRTTQADFKGFAVGDDLSRKAPSGELADSLGREIDHFLTKPSQRDSTMEKLAAEPAVARNLIEDKARALEEQAASLRKLQKQVHRQAVGRELAALLQRPADQTELMRAALLIARHDNAEVDVEGYLKNIEHMAADLKNDAALKQGTPAAARRLAKYLFEENGFHGSRDDDMDNLSNSYINEVLDDREGIPITLSIVYLELARRLGLKEVYGLSLPGRFMVGFDEMKDGMKVTTVIDPFGGGKVLSVEQAAALLGNRAALLVDEQFLEPATPRAIVLRMLRNFANYAKKQENKVAYLDLIISIEPDSSSERLNRALLEAQSGDVASAKRDLEKLIESRPANLDMDKIEALYRSL